MTVERDPSLPPTPERTSHPFPTYEMIYEIPDTIAKTFEVSTAQVDLISEKLKDSSDIYFTGCGTAFRSALLRASILSLTGSDLSRYECVQALELSN